MFKKGAMYLISNYVIQGLNIIINILFMQRLPATTLGDISIARTWMQFLDYSHLGTRFSLDRFVPIEEKNKSKYLLLISLAVTVFFNSLLIIALLVQDFNLIVLSFVVVGAILAQTNVIKSYERALGNIDKMLLVVILVQFVPLLVSLIIYFFGTFELFIIFYPFIYGLMFLISIVSLRKTLVIKKFKFKRAIIFCYKVLKPSLILFINSLFIFIYLVMDRFIIDGMFGREMLGHYSVIYFVFTALLIIPSTTAELLFPRIIKQSSQLGRCIYPKEMCLTFIITLSSVILANSVMKYFINEFTSYGDLIDYLKVMTFAVVPFAFTSIFAHVLNGLDARKVMALANLSTVLIFGLFFLLTINYKSSLWVFVYAKLALGWVVLTFYLLGILYVKIQKKNSVIN